MCMYSVQPVSGCVGVCSFVRDGLCFAAPWQDSRFLRQCFLWGWFGFGACEVHPPGPDVLPSSRFGSCFGLPESLAVSANLPTSFEQSWAAWFPASNVRGGTVCWARMCWCSCTIVRLVLQHRPAPLGAAPGAASDDDHDPADDSDDADHGEHSPRCTRSPQAGGNSQGDCHGLCGRSRSPRRADPAPAASVTGVQMTHPCPGLQQVQVMPEQVLQMPFGFCNKRISAAPPEGHPCLA